MSIEIDNDLIKFIYQSFQTQFQIFAFEKKITKINSSRQETQKEKKQQQHIHIDLSFL
jgi:hypothetical protein